MLEKAYQVRPIPRQVDRASWIDDIVLKLFRVFGDLLFVLNQDGFVIFISGAKDQGKTNISLLLAEICHVLNFRRNLATNIWTESYMIQRQITNYDSLQQWFESDKSRKLYVLDELGKILKKMRFMSEVNQLIMDTVQLVRHYKAGFIGVAPSEDFIDSLFMNTDILDARIYKESRSVTRISLVRSKQSFRASHTPSTSIRYNSLDTASFTLHAPIKFDTLQLCCKVAMRYGETGSYEIIQKELGMRPKRIRELIRRHLKHTSSFPLSSLRGGSSQQQKEKILFCEDHCA